jgi:hypothetical protein
MNKLDDLIFSSNYEIIKYLDFNSKIILGKVLNKSFTNYYDFSQKNYKNQYLYNLFHEQDYWYGDNDDIVKEITNNFRNNYVEYESGGSSDGEYDDDSEVYSDINDLLQRTVNVIYTRKIIELIENNNDILKKIYNKEDNIWDIYNEFDENLQKEIDNDIINYYKKIFDNKTNLDLFCYRCGEFGHYDSSKLCLFYNEKFEKYNIKQEVRDILNCLNFNVNEKIKEELKNKIKKESTCKKCNIYLFSSKCSYKLCGNCCDKNECKKHKKKSK